MSDPHHLERLARLSTLALSADELAALANEFEPIVDFIDQLSAAPAADLAMTNQVTDLENIYRRDDVVQYEHHRTLVDLAPAVSDGLVRVPGVFSEGDPDVA